VTLCAILTVVLVLASVALAVGAEPMPTPGMLASGDSRSDGSGPGLVGSPLVVLAGVVVLGAATAILTALLARARRRG
jgi:hypothetical protein